jgi:outer membrane protein assembly factor BamB
MANVCKANPPITTITNMPAWNGWGADATNARFQLDKSAGIPANRASGLKLRWAFGFPAGSSMYGQPAVAAGHVFIGLNSGFVYSIDAASGCVHWSFQARSGVRNAISIGEIRGQGRSRFAVYFGDIRANVYAVDASTGKLLWENRVDDDAVAGITGAPPVSPARLLCMKAACTSRFRRAKKPMVRVLCIRAAHSAAASSPSMPVPAREFGNPG